MPDKVVTYVSANSEVVRMNFTPQPGGAVLAEVMGRTKDSLGNFTQPTQYTIALPSSDPIAIAVTSLATGQALAFWKGKEGL